MRVVVWITRQMSARMSAIVAASAILTAGTLGLGGCGQRSALYLPTVPPLPTRPVDLERTQPPSSRAVTAPDEEAASAPDASTIPDTTGTPLSLSPDSELRTVPDAATGATGATNAPSTSPSAQPHPASDASPVQ